MTQTIHLINEFLSNKHLVTFNAHTNAITIESIEKSVHDQIFSFLASKEIEVNDFVYYYFEGNLIIQEHPKLI